MAVVAAVGSKVATDKNLCSTLSCVKDMHLTYSTVGMQTLFEIYIQMYADPACIVWGIQLRYLLCGGVFKVFVAITRNHG